MAALSRAFASILDRSIALTTATILYVALIVPAFSFGQADHLPAVAESDLVHYGDVIDVDVLGNLEYDWRGSVNQEGFLDGLALAREPIYALCKSEADIADEIMAQYAKILRDPRIVVKVLDKSNRAATLLLGAVRNQQRFKIKREAKLSELLAVSGGITDTASGEVTVFRPGDLNCFPRQDGQESKSLTMKFSLAELLSGSPDANPVIISGDIVTIVEASPIYVIGGVNTPRQLSSRDEMTVTRAVSAAGGLAKEALETEITIYRRDGKDGKVLSVDLKKIRAGQQADAVLRPFDIVDVGQKGRARPKFAPNVTSEKVSRDIFKLPIRIIE